MKIIWPNVHLYLWTPWHASNQRGFGATVRARVDNGWQNYRVLLLERNPIDHKYWERKARDTKTGFRVRRTLMVLELCRWKTDTHEWGPYPAKRQDVKAYLRVKASAGGARIIDGNEASASRRMS
jgi:hypothetical protein